MMISKMRDQWSIYDPVKIKTLTYLSFELGEASVQTGSGPGGQPQNTILVCFVQRCSKWKKAAVDYTFSFQLSHSEEAQTHFHLFELWISPLKEKWKRNSFKVNMLAVLAIHWHFKWKVSQVVSWYKFMTPCWFPTRCTRKLASYSLTINP